MKIKYKMKEGFYYPTPEEWDLLKACIGEKGEIGIIHRVDTPYMWFSINDGDTFRGSDKKIQRILSKLVFGKDPTFGGPYNYSFLSLDPTECFSIEIISELQTYGINIHEEEGFIDLSTKTTPEELPYYLGIMRGVFMKDLNQTKTDI